MSLQITVDIRFVAALALAKELGRFAALVLDVTIEAVLPLVLALAVATRPRFGVAARVHHFVAVRQTLALDAPQRLFARLGGRGHRQDNVRLAGGLDRLVAELIGRTDHRCGMMVAAAQTAGAPIEAGRRRRRRGGHSGRRATGDHCGYVRLFVQVRFERPRHGMRDAQVVVAACGMGVSERRRRTGVSFGVSVDEVAFVVSAHKFGRLEVG